MAGTWTKWLLRYILGEESLRLSLGSVPKAPPTLTFSAFSPQKRTVKMAQKIDGKEHFEYGNDEKQTEAQLTPDVESKGSKELKTGDNGLSSDEVVIEHDKKETRRILRKIDYRLVPLLGILYL